MVRYMFFCPQLGQLLRPAAGRSAAAAAVAALAASARDVAALAASARDVTYFRIRVGYASKSETVKQF